MARSASVVASVAVGSDALWLEQPASSPPPTTAPPYFTYSLRDDNKRIALAIVVSDVSGDRFDESAMNFSGCSSLVWAQVVEPAQLRPEITVKPKECLIVRLVDDVAVIGQSPGVELTIRELGACQHRHKLPA